MFPQGTLRSGFGNVPITTDALTAAQECRMSEGALRLPGLKAEKRQRPYPGVKACNPHTPVRVAKTRNLISLCDPYSTAAQTN